MCEGHTNKHHKFPRFQIRNMLGMQQYRSKINKHKCCALQRKRAVLVSEVECGTTLNHVGW